MQLLLLLLLAAWSPLAAPPAAAVGQDGDRRVEELLDRIRTRRDDVAGRTLTQLAQVGTPAALEGLKLATTWLRDPEPLRKAYAAFHELRERPGLADDAMDFLLAEALRAARAVNRVEAARGLLRWEGRTAGRLEELLHEAKDEAVRHLVLPALVPELCARGDASALRLILDNVPAQAAYDLEGRLWSFRSPPARALLLDAARDRERPSSLRTLVLERLAEEPGTDVDELLVQMVSERAPDVQLAAIDALVQRGKGAAARAPLWRLIKARNRDVRLAAIAALGRSLVGDAEWEKKLFALARGKDEVARLGATTGLLELRTAEALEKLHELLADDDWRVRVGALHAVEALRTPHAVEVLIARLDAETGRMRLDVARALQRLTGMRFGPSRDRWNAWWEDHRHGFVPPAADELAQREMDTLTLQESSVATFYGLPVFSERLAIVMDVSGSMAKRAEGLTELGGEYERATRAPTRLGVAKRQLYQLLERVPNGHLLNVIFFEEYVDAWRDEVAPLDEEKRDEVTEFVVLAVAGGGTNLYDALSKAMDDTLLDTIYVLSDGQPTAGAIVHPAGIRRAILTRNRRARVQFFCVSIGRISDVLFELAEETGGRYIEIGVAAQEAHAHAHELLLRRDLPPRRYRRALELAQEACRKEPANARFHTSRALAFWRLGRPGLAREVLEGSETMSGSREPALRSRRLALQALLLAGDEPARARELLGEALELAREPDPLLAEARETL